MCIHIEVATAADVEAILAVQRAAYELKETPLYGPDLPPLREAPAMLTDELLAGVVILKAMEDSRIVGSSDRSASCGKTTRHASGGSASPRIEWDGVLVLP